ncbi:MAG: hypothetical protein MN733_06880 [Nitrososphaera sp.]|nr:hypothetical protein [Nitrososphaera sp.]
MSDETIPQMREQIEALVKDLDLAKSNASTLAKENRRLLARDVARDNGFAASRGDLFASVSDGDITAEGFLAFTQANDLAPLGSDSASTGSSGGGDLTPSAPVGSADLSQMARGGSRPGDSAGGASQEKMSRQAWQELYANDPAAAREAVRQGRVEIASGNPFGDAKSVAAGRNPYSG